MDTTVVEDHTKTNPLKLVHIGHVFSEEKIFMVIVNGLTDKCMGDGRKVMALSHSNLYTRRTYKIDEITVCLSY